MHRVVKILPAKFFRGNRVIYLALLAGALLVAMTQGISRQMSDFRASTGGVIPAIPVSLALAEARDLEVWEPAIGQLETKVSPLVAAEVAGRLTAVKVDVGDQVNKGQVLAEIDAEDFRLARDIIRKDIDRLQALNHAQQLRVKRYRTLVKKLSVDRSTLDDAEAQLGALRAELAATRVRLQQARRNLSKTRIISPIDGRVDDTWVSSGDYVKVGSPLMRIDSLHWLKARLPYPETLLARLHPGLAVRLRSPSAPKVMIETRVSEVRPSITFGSRSAQVIVNVENPGPWQPGATVSASVRVARHENAVMLPELSVVRRAVGTVVYLVSGGKALQRMVTTGLRRDGQVEILSGIATGESVVADGAGFLSDGAPVRIALP